MKINHAFFMMVLLLSLSACEKDEGSSTNDGLIGTWELIEYTYEGTSTANSGGQSFTSNFVGDARDIDASVDFKADSTYASRGSFTIDLTYDVGGQSINQPFTITDFIGSGTYSLQGNNMTITDDQSNTTNNAVITTLEGDDMEMDFVFKQTQVQQGVTNVIVLDGHYTLKRK